MKKITLCFALSLLISSGTFAQSIYKDSLRTSFSFATSFSKIQNYGSFGSGGVLSFKKGIDFGFLKTNHKELKSPNNRQTRDGIGWGGYISVLASNELRGAPFGMELGFIFTKQIYEQDLSDYKLKTEFFGMGVNFSKKISLEERGFISPQLSYNFFPVAKAREKEDWRSDYVAYKYSNISFVLPLALNMDTFVFVLEPGISFTTIPEVFFGSLGLVFYSR